MADTTTPAANAAAFSPAADDVFARIAGRYDFLCDLFSLSAHRVWKRRMARVIADSPGHVVLDIASGTGDIPLRLMRRLVREGRSKQVLATDICPQMLAVARRRLGVQPGLTIAIADAHDLSDVAAVSVDVLSISFAMKICDRRRILSEAARVLKPGGLFLCLEAARIPFAPLHRAYLAYVDWCVPMIARLATGNDRGAYDYLSRGIHGFPDQTALAREIEAAGFRDVGYDNLTFGIVALHRGIRAA